jgi:signal transduction histidine kinase
MAFGAANSESLDTPEVPSHHRHDRARRGRLLLWTYALAAFALWLVSVRASLLLVDATFPGFLVLDNGILASVYARDWTGPRAGLPFDGGVVAEIDGRPFPGGRALYALAAAREPGATVAYAVARAGERRTFAVATMRFTWSDWAATFGAYLFVATTLLAIGGLALALRPDHLTARSLAATLGCVGALFALAVDHLTGYQLIRAYHVCEALAPAAILNLALVFPRERLRPAMRRRVVAAVALGLLAAAGAESWVFYDRPQLAWRWDAGIYSLMALLGLAMIASFAESLARGRDPAERTRAALVFTGGLFGFLLPAAALFAFFLLGVELPTTVWAPFLAVFALFLLYAIVRHDLLEAERVVRLGVGYALATVGMLLAYALVLSLLGRFVWAGTLRGPVASFLLVLAVAVSFEPLRQRVQKAIDRLFYRSHVDVARALEEASADLISLETERDIGAYVERLLGGELGTEWVRAGFGEDDRPPGGALLSAPVVFRSERLGFIACGAKRSGAPFSAAEMDLLAGLASQAALAVHHVRTLQALRAAQETLVRTERLAAVGQFAGAVAHGIRNPLAGIRAAAQVAHLRGTRGELALDSLSNVMSESDRLDHRIRSLLDFSRPFQLRKQTVDLGLLVESVRRSLATRGGDGIAIRTDATHVVIDADPAYLEEALLELGNNALRAMPSGGALAIRVEIQPGAAVLRFEDTGGGVPDGARARLFDLFYTTHPDGTGIGLATVRKILELHGGEVELERSDASGSVFRVVLPTDATQSSSSSSSSVNPPPGGAPMPSPSSSGENKTSKG